jgi:acetoin utilization deacetylase AcuC-like enzyme
MSPTAVYYHPLFIEHDTGDHPENKKRLIVAKRVLEESGLELEWITPKPAPIPAIARVHDLDYIEGVRSVAEKGGGWMDSDTVVSLRSYDAALLAAGAGLMAVVRALAGGSPAGGQKAFLLVRPPGHHACRARAMGFCLFNNIAIAAAYALEELDVSRVLIVDWDVHHGNGTQAAFYGDQRVLFFSMHQAGHYPGTGMAREIGIDQGRGFTVDVPLQSGAGDGAVRLAFESLLLPLARAFRPELVLVSAGYDPQEGDILGGLRFSEEAFQWMAACLSELSQEIGAAGPVCFLEGGYVPEMAAKSIVATIRGMQGQKPEFQRTASADERADVREALEEAKPQWEGVL